MPKIYRYVAVEGYKNRGKTTLIGQLRDFIIKGGASKLYPATPDSPNGDFVGVWNYKGKIIALVSAGDDFESVLNGVNVINEFWKQNPQDIDTIIVAISLIKGNGKRQCVKEFWAHEAYRHSVGLEIACSLRAKPQNINFSNEFAKLQAKISI